MTTTEDAQQTNNTQQIPGLTEEENRKAAEIIQRTYRGHRTRRQLNGHGLDASTRWYETVQAARYQARTTPRSPEDKNALTKTKSPARGRWEHVTHIARHAGTDDMPSSDSEDPSISEESDLSESLQRTTSKNEEEKKQLREARERHKRTAKTMDLQYWLEMVDQKHRYGSNLRKYHNYWKGQDTNQNFFYWLDQGDGREVEVEECSRARLDREQVRYLSREERLQYLVKINEEGLLIWAKNGEKVWTKDELFRDSVKGIVPVDDPAPSWRHDGMTDESESSSDEATSDDSEDDNDDEDNDKKLKRKGSLEGERYVNESFHRAKGPAKLKHVSAAVLFNHMIRTSLKKGHKWIFVADTSFRLYVGYKQSGAFQHSSFLHGSRILSAGLIKVKDGQLRRLSPLSGHYRPPAASFRAFVHALRDSGVDMSRVSISRSYAVLVGLEGYVKTRRKVKKAQKSVTHEFDKVVNPEKVKAEEEALQDKSQSAAREREYLEEQRKAQEQKAGVRGNSPQRLSSKFSRAWGRLTGKGSASESQNRVIKHGDIPGAGPEDGIPAPEGKR